MTTYSNLIKTSFVVKDSDGSKRWYRGGELHREEGPAIEWYGGSKEWYQNGVLHRVGGPARIFTKSRYNQEEIEEYWVWGKKIEQGRELK